MSDKIIEVKNISKKYRIGSVSSYYSLRDVIAGIAKSPAQLFKKRAKVDEEIYSDEFWALKDVSFDINRGDILGVVGANGAGKSTLLKILTQITPPTKGEALLRGRVASLLEVGTGFHPELTARENIYLNGAILGMKRWEISNKFDQIIEFAEVGQFLDTPVKHFSSGMYMKLAFSVAAHLEPEILLVDEVLAVGDAAFQKKSLGKMSEVTKQGGRTIIFVSHNMGAIQSLCNRAILLDKGQLKSIGKTEAVVEKYLKNSIGAKEILIKDRRDRQGSGKLKVTKVYFKDKDSKVTTFLRSGEDVEIIVEYKVSDNSLKKFDFSIGIDSFLNQTRIAFIGNQMFGKKVNILENPLRIKIKRLPLNAGRYQFTLFFVDPSGDILDWVQKAGIFNVEYGDFYGEEISQIPDQSHGSLLLDYRIENL